MRQRTQQRKDRERESSSRKLCCESFSAAQVQLMADRGRCRQKLSSKQCCQSAAALIVVKIVEVVVEMVVEL